MENVLMVARVENHYRIVIPKRIRDYLLLKEGDYVVFEIKGMKKEVMLYRFEPEPKNETTVNIISTG